MAYAESFLLKKLAGSSTTLVFTAWRMHVAEAHSSRREALRSALGLWANRLLAAMFYPWRAATRRESRAHALRRRILSVILSDLQAEAFYALADYVAQTVRASAAHDAQLSAQAVLGAPLSGVPWSEPPTDDGLDVPAAAELVGL